MSAKRCPRVSVVMSVHNDVARLGLAVSGILGQTYQDLELIVIDDGSGDGTAESLDHLAASDPRLRVVHQENTGLTIAMGRGCALARGEFIARQDSDDWSLPLRIAEQVALMDAEARIGFVSCATQYIGPGNEALCVVRRDDDPERATYGLLSRREGPPAHGSTMFRKSLYEAVGGYRPQFHYAQDSDLWLRMAEQAWIGYLPQVRYVHRKEAASTSGAARAAQRRLGELGHLCRRARMAGESEQPWVGEAQALSARVRAGMSLGPAQRRRALADANYLLGALLAVNCNSAARRYLLQSIQQVPWRIKPWLRLGQSLLTGRARPTFDPSGDDSHQD